MKSSIVTFVCILLCISRATYADLIELCHNSAAQAKVEGVVINPVTVNRTERCQLDLTDIAPNSWVHLKFHHGDTILQLCNNSRPVNITCPGDRDMRDCSNGNIICYVSRNATTSQNITVIVHGRIITNLPGLFMSYKVAQVILYKTGNASVYSSDVIGSYGYVVSDSRYPDLRNYSDKVHTLNVRLPRQYQTRNISVSVIDFGPNRNCDDFSITLNAQRTICSNNATIPGNYRIRSTLQANRPTRQGFSFSFKVNSWYKRGFMLLYKEAERTIDNNESTTITTRTATVSSQIPGYTRTSITNLPVSMLTTCQCPTVSPTTTTNTDTTIRITTSTVAGAAIELSSLRETIAERQRTITTLTAICVVLGLLFIIVSVAFVILVMKQRPCCTMNKADCPGEFAVNRAYSSDAVKSAPSPHDTGFAAKSRATPIGGNDYSYVGDHILADRGVSHEQNKSHEDHVYAGTDYYDLADDTELSPQCNQYKLADEIEPIADRKQEEDNFYHCVEPSAPPGSTLPTGQYVDVESLQASTELAQNQVETTTKISETDADDGYIDLSKVPAEHVRLSALLDTENHKGDQEDNVKLVENTLYHSQS